MLMKAVIFDKKEIFTQTPTSTSSWSDGWSVSPRLQKVINLNKQPYTSAGFQLDPRNGPPNQQLGTLRLQLWRKTCLIELQGIGSSSFKSNSSFYGCSLETSGLKPEAVIQPQPVHASAQAVLINVKHPAGQLVLPVWNLQWCVDMASLERAHTSHATHSCILQYIHAYTPHERVHSLSRGELMDTLTNPTTIFATGVVTLTTS